MDGSLDYPDELLAELDWVIGSVHTSFNISEKAMTERVIAAMEHPLVDCIGHLTGRLLLRREPYAVDIERIAEAAARTGTMMEINGNPNRRDLNERSRQAGGRGRGADRLQHGRPRHRDAEQHQVLGGDRAPRLAGRRSRSRTRVTWRSFAPLRKRAKALESGFGSFELPGARRPSRMISTSRGQRPVAGPISPA